MAPTVPSACSVAPALTGCSGTRAGGIKGLCIPPPGLMWFRGRPGGGAPIV